MFFNELDILEIRLNTLNDLVDKFVLVEGTKSKTNKDKELYYAKNKERFAKFNDKIIHIVVDDFPEYSGNPWVYENFQRNAIERGLTNCKDDDIIMISDLDEIPNPKKVMEVINLPGIKALDMNLFYYSLNNLAVGINWTSGTKILNYKDFKSILDDVNIDSACCVNEYNKGTTATKIRLYKKNKKQKHFHNAGWHFSFVGDLNKLITKIDNYCDRDLILQGRKIEEVAINLLKDSENNPKYKAVEIDKSFPEYLYLNQEKYKNLIRTPNTKKTLKELSKKSKPKEYLRLPCKLLIALIPSSRLRGKLRLLLSKKINVNYI